MKSSLLRYGLTGLILCARLAFAGTTGKITGTVKDEQTGEPVIGANVVVDGTALGASTNLDGYYVILNVPPGRYTISASSVGYSKKTITDVVVSIDLTTTLDIVISSKVIQGEEVVVRAERQIVKKDLTSSEARVDASQIAAIPTREVNEVLTLQAGVTVDRGGGIHIRGGRTSEVGYWVNGVSVSDVYDGSQAVQVDNKSIQELQIISGTFNAEYGQAMSGIINIVTKDGGQQFHGGISAYAGSYVTNDPIFFNMNTIRPFNDRDVEGNLNGPLIPGFNDLTFYVSGRYFKSDGWLYGNKVFNTNGTLAVPVDTVRDASGNMVSLLAPNNPVAMNGRERWSGQFKLTYQLSPTIKLNVSGLGSDITYRDYNHAYRLDPDGDVTQYDNGFDLSTQWTQTLGSTSFYTVNLSLFRKQYKSYLYENPLDPNYIVDPAAQVTNLDEFFRAGTNNGHFSRNTDTHDLKVDYTNQVSELHQLKLGFEGRIHKLYLESYSVTPLQDTTVVNGVLTPGYIATIPPTTSPLYQQYDESPVEFSAYVQDKLEYAHMIVNVGVRYDYFNSRGQVLADPQDPNVYLPQETQHEYI
ncbi:MAG TPA: TonB-dependent receptor, partial [Bacteroidota bacterium]|nr:TonB-dependent receptor [Bacteroidota bacterium]